MTGGNFLTMAIASGALVTPAHTRIGRDLTLDVCICTHNPRTDIFQLVLKALVRQTEERKSFRVLIVDNASKPSLRVENYGLLSDAGIAVSIVREIRLGNIFARARVYQETTGNWILFVDDDNELEPDYIEKGLEIIRNRPELGCFGGKLKMPEKIKVPEWMKPLVPFLAIRDFGDKEITNIADHWGEWEPVTAGGFIRRDVLGLFARRVLHDPETHVLGRKGNSTLNSCEDSLMMAGAFHLGLACSYQPGLSLNHHVRPERFQLSYLLRLMYGFGRSEVMLDHLCGRNRNIDNQDARSSWRAMFVGFIKDRSIVSWQYALCMLARRAGMHLQHKRVAQGSP
jgi:glycosyltransferase involved in cell wall biosynthesis